MGLKNKNYTINGYEYPEVYAVFNGNVRKLGVEYIVGFNIHATRELALNEKPLEVKEVRLRDWDRNSDIVAYAYQKGKEQIKIGNWKPQDGVFTGWQDDIL